MNREVQGGGQETPTTAWTTATNTAEVAAEEETRGKQRQRSDTISEMLEDNAWRMKLILYKSNQGIYLY